MVPRLEGIHSQSLQHYINGTNPNGHCPGCNAREEQLVFLREQVRTLQDKLLCLVPEAADRAHRMQLTQMANMRPEVFNGMVPLDDTMQTEDDGFNHWYEQLTKMGRGRTNG